jgi:hypothetical protein
MNRSSLLLLIAIALGAYGLYAASFVPAMMVGPVQPVLLVAFVVQAVCALVAAVGVWKGASWAAGAVILLGITVAVTWLFEGFILGIVAYLYAILMAAIAAIATVIVLACINRQGVRSPVVAGPDALHTRGR